MRTAIHRLAMPFVAALALVACERTDAPGRDTLAGPGTTGADTGQSASCLPITPEIRGSLVGQRAAAQREARRVRVSGDGVSRRDSAGALITIVPACGSHAFRAEDLARGQFVARLTIDGSAPRFSRFANDTVYWWVYLDLTSGVPVYHSQFLSTRAQEDGNRVYLRRADFVIRCKAEGERPRTEQAGWEQVHEPEACPGSDAQLRFIGGAAAQPTGVTLAIGDSPWFGCILGCCQSSRFFVDEQ